jgi:hypothetical protein
VPKVSCVPWPSAVLRFLDIEMSKMCMALQYLLILQASALMLHSNRGARLLCRPFTDPWKDRTLDRRKNWTAFGIVVRRLTHA